MYIEISLDFQTTPVQQGMIMPQVMVTTDYGYNGYNG